jgi:hypothetical protein
MGKLGIWRPVDRYQSGSLRIKITPRRLVFHTAVSSATSMHSFFNVSGRATPHFYVNEAGVIEQFIDTGFRATACLDGNNDCVAVESWDGGHERDWTALQVEACARIAVFCHTEHNIPLDRCPSSKPGSQGVGWHRLGIDGDFPQPPGQLLGGRVDGGEHWSTSTGKECPWTIKIHGVVDKIIPRARQLLTDGDDMQQSDDLTPLDDTQDETVGYSLRTVLKLPEQIAAVKADVDGINAELDTRFQAVNSNVNGFQEATKNRLKALDAAVAEVLAAVKAL